MSTLAEIVDAAGGIEEAEQDQRLYRDRAVYLRLVLALLGQDLPACLPHQDEACGRSFLAHVSSYLAAISAVAQAERAKVIETTMAGGCVECGEDHEPDEVPGSVDGLGPVVDAGGEPGDEQVQA